jgi:hypothetical protein
VAPVPYIRTTNGPSGKIRPIPGNVNFYATPAIWISNPNDAGQDKAVAVADTDQLVIVEVGNLGDTQAEVDEWIVQVWAAGFGTVSGAATTLDGKTRPNDAVVPAGSEGIPVSIPWTPQATDLAGTDAGHFCIRANVFLAANPADKLSSSNDVNVPAQVRHAQRNMTMIPKVSLKADFSFTLITANPDPRKTGKFGFEIVEVTGPLEPAEIFHIQDSPYVLRADRRGHFTLRQSDGKTKVRTPIRKPLKRPLLQLGERTASRFEARYEPGEARPMTMHLDFGKDEDGLIRRFDVIQRGPKGVVGAARVMTISVPELLEGGADDPPRKGC